MNKFWIVSAAIIVSVGGWLYARGFGERYSELNNTPQAQLPQGYKGSQTLKFDLEGNEGNESFEGEGNASAERLKAQEEEQRLPNRTNGTKMQPRWQDNRSQFEKEERQGPQNEAEFEKMQQELHQMQPVAQLTPSREPLTLNANYVSDAVRNFYPQSANWFRGNFWEEHGMYPYPGLNAWRAANWWNAASWVGANDEDAVYYDPNGNTVDVGEQGSPQSSTYTPTGQNIAENDLIDNGTISSDQQWMSLGVYALGTETVDPAESNLFVQLAANKQGHISGTFYNAKTDKAEPITGEIDKDSQMAWWKLADRPDSPIGATGLYNLTQPATAINAIMSDSSQRTWYMVKLQ